MYLTGLSTPEWPRTSVSHTPSPRRLVTRPLLSPGELVSTLFFIYGGASLVGGSERDRQARHRCCRNVELDGIVELPAENGNADRITSQVALLPVFPVSPVVELTVPVRLPSVTCAVPVACSPQPRSGASGTRS